MNSDIRKVRPVWRKSSYSTGTGNCVEYARTSGSVLVRDSKRPEAGSIDFSSAAWAGLLSGSLDGRAV